MIPPDSSRQVSRPETAPAPSRSSRSGAASARASATGSGCASGCDPAAEAGGRSHPGGKKVRANAAGISDRRRGKDFFEPIATPAAGSRRPGEIRQLCIRRPGKIHGFARLRPEALPSIVRGLTPVLGRDKQPSHSRSSGPHRNRRAGRIGRFPGRLTRICWPPRGTVIRPWQRDVRGPARERRRGTIRYG
jgi:hypothetical protein